MKKWNVTEQENKYIFETEHRDFEIAYDAFINKKVDKNKNRRSINLTGAVPAPEKREKARENGRTNQALQKIFEQQKNKSPTSVFKITIPDSFNGKLQKWSNKKKEKTNKHYISR